jgi:hypothetical protein
VPWPPDWGGVANCARILSDDITAGWYLLFAVRPASEFSVSLLQRIGSVCKTERIGPTANNVR